MRAKTCPSALFSNQLLLKISLRKECCRTSSKASSQDKMASLLPLSPCLAQRPISCLSIRVASWRSVNITCSPPRSLTPSCNTISVPSPAIFVAMVIFPFTPAPAIIPASSASCFAFNTWWDNPALLKCSLNTSEAAKVRVPISTGLPVSAINFTLSTSAFNFSCSVAYTLSCDVFLSTGL